MGMSAAATDATAVAAEPFPAKYHLFVLAPYISSLLWYLLAQASPGEGDESSWLGGLVTLVAAGLMIYGYIHQIQHIRRSMPQKQLKQQYALAIGAFAVPILAAILGDISGVIEFGGSANTDSALWVLAAAGGIYGSWILGFIAIGNIITIANHGLNNALRIIGIILQVLAWVATLGLAFFFYIFAYAARDPNSE